MRNHILCSIYCILLLTGCVQKTYKKIVVFELDTSAVPNITTVGIRGKDKPLNWNTSTALTPVKKDSSYTITVSFVTGYTFTEVKFTVNDELELQDKENRRIHFSAKDTTFYKAVFDKSK